MTGSAMEAPTPLDTLVDRRTFLCGLAAASMPLLASCAETGDTDSTSISPASETEQPPEAAPTSEFSPLVSWELDLSRDVLDESQLKPNLNPAVPTWTGDGENPATNEQQAYTNRPENMRVENDELIITARKEAAPYRYEGNAVDYQYTSARLESFDSNDGSELANGLTFEYGKVEVTAKIPEAVGTWPAPLWLYSANMPATNNRVQQAIAEGADQAAIDALWGTGLDGEFDFEMYGRNPGKVEMTAHTFNAPEGGYTKTVDLPPSPDGYRRYAIAVSPDKVVWSVEGVDVYVFERPAANPSVEDWPIGRGNKFGIIMNVALGGEAAGPIAEGIGPQEMRIKRMQFFDYTGGPS